MTNFLNLNFMVPKNKYSGIATGVRVCQLNMHAHGAVMLTFSDVHGE